MVDHTLLNLSEIQAGVRRDGTVFSSTQYTDAQWCRFYNNRPRKMGGYRYLGVGVPYRITGTTSVTTGQEIRLFIGTTHKIYVTTFDLSGHVIESLIDITPSEGFEPNELNQWSFDFASVTLTIEGANEQVEYIVAHVAPTLGDTASPNEGPIFYGPVSGGAPLKLSKDMSNPN